MSFMSLRRAVLVELDRRLGLPADLGGLELDPRLDERLAHGGEVGGLGEDLEDVLVLVDVLGAGLDRGHEVVLGVLLGVDDDDALLVEEVGDRAGLAEVAAVLGEQVADLRPGAVAVVGHRLDEHRDAARAVALVDDGLPVLGVRAGAGALGDRPLDVVLGHRGVLGLLHGERRARRCRSGRPPPSFAATVIARASFVNSLPRRASTIAFLCLIPAHLEWPAMALRR